MKSIRGNPRSDTLRGDERIRTAVPAPGTDPAYDRRGEHRRVVPSGDIGSASDRTALRMAYADPPYPGQSRRHYKDHPDYAGEVDHANLIAELVGEYPDGWALSTSSTALRDVIALCPDYVRVAAWVKPFAAFKNQRVTFAWEPVIYHARRGAAERVPGGLVRDWVSATPQVFRNGTRTGVAGTKPLAFCFWLFDLLGMTAEDELYDLFPGSGAVGDAFTAWRRQMRIGVPS